jgi:hypothetical protein
MMKLERDSERCRVAVLATGPEALWGATANAMGAAATPGTPEDFRNFLQADTAKWTELLGKFATSR